ncbi:DUF484 family protein [Inhella gelatinilytica]|uniref:DUF484 family protein n=1 Tax=Inhella gelatinilytica TaxID=2795030 RepID=A0A931IX02_9BURK|nr:DUF484 family protein [Inhella gelatinilytica]MBH9552193.1 DUF484 family protein [Inhella gelatinilytica]
MSAAPLDGITEADIANYLAANPSFFERHAELLHHIQLSHPLGHRTVSLQERQAEMLRERIKGLERKIIEMIRAGTENLGHFEKLQAWTLALIQVQDPTDLPARLQAELRDRFLIPATALRLFHDGGCSDEVRQFATDLLEPYCGVHEAGSGSTEPAQWLASEGQAVASLALIPLRRAGQREAFGLLALGSPDATRYSAEKGTEFLIRVGEVASAALARLVPAND